MKLPANLPILLIRAKLRFIGPRNSKTDEQVEWFELIGHISEIKSCIFIILALENAFLAEKEVILLFQNSKNDLDIILKYVP